MAITINFPSDPTVGQQYTYAGRTWQWNGTVWLSLGIQGIQGTQGLGNQGVQGTIGIQGREGYIGLDGAQGVQGTRGIQGYYGPFGDSAGIIYRYHSVNLLPGYIVFSTMSPSTITFSNIDYYGAAFDFSWLVKNYTGQVLAHLYIQSNNSTYNNFAIYSVFEITYDSETGWATASVELQTGTNFINGQIVSMYFVFVGEQGVQGQIGIQGREGYIGLDGSQGVQGTQGLQGELGSQGVQGLQGESIQGLQGTQGLQGIIGIQGVQGTQGLQGEIGIQGSFGESIQGTQGEIGIQGNLGSQGVIGDSIQGIEGSQGVQGLLGSEGFISIIEESSGSFTASLTHKGNYTRVNYASGVNVTIPADTFSPGDVLCFEQTGNGAITTLASGTTLNGYDGLTSYGQYAVLTVVCVASNVFNVIAGTGF